MRWFDRELRLSLPGWLSMAEDILISTDRSQLDIAMIHGFLSNSYWAKGISLATVQKSIDHSLCFGVYQEQQIGFARVITDYAMLGYLADVFVLESHRGQGIGKKLVAHILAYPDLQHLRKWLLVTWDAHEFYHQSGFELPRSPQNYMEIVNPNPYGRLP